MNRCTLSWLCIVAFVLANPQSPAFRDYLDRLYLHTRKLTAFMSEIPVHE